MVGLNEAIGKTEGDHRTALQWFVDHTGEDASWSAMQDFSTKTVRLVNQAKGIYKPAGSDYALSVRQTLNGPYADKPVNVREDGTWQFLYFQENANPAYRDTEATNRGLMRCYEDGIPIGVLLQTKPKPGATYRILGLALVADWQDGYFILEGFGPNGRVGASEDNNAVVILQRYEQLASDDAEFNPDDRGDERERQVAQVVRRRGQGRFRRRLIDAYGGKCAVTGCDALDGLDAAHISPYRGERSNSIRNGLLLRSDIHNLFDLGLIAVDVQTMTLVLSDRLANTSYRELSGSIIRMPLDKSRAPSAEALAGHRSWANI
jgi:hypothetical protein